MIGSRAVTDLQLDPSAVFGWVDLHRCRQRLGRWHSTHEALGVCDLSLFEHAAFDLEDGAPASVMHHLGSGIGDTRMTVLGVVPGGEVPAPGACVIIATVAIWVARRVTSNSLTASTCVMPPVPPSPPCAASPLGLPAATNGHLFLSCPHYSI